MADGISLTFNFTSGAKYRKKIKGIKINYIFGQMALNRPFTKKLNKI